MKQPAYIKATVIRALIRDYFTKMSTIATNTVALSLEIQRPGLQRMMTMNQKMTSPWLCWLPFSMEVALMLMMRSSTSVPLTDDDIVPEVQSSSRAQVEEEDI